MNHIGFHCKGNCSKETLHQIEGFDESGKKANYARLKCIKCNEPSFVVQYPKGANAPTSNSHRLLTDNETSIDNFLSC